MEPILLNVAHEILTPRLLLRVPRAGDGERVNAAIMDSINELSRWMIWMHRFFQDLAETYGLPGMPDFMRRDDAVATYESLTGHTPRDIELYMFYGALRHGVIMARIHRRAIRFGQAEMPDDPDDLVVHRQTLETMMDGSYWARL